VEGSREIGSAEPTTQRRNRSWTFEIGPKNRINFFNLLESEKGRSKEMVSQPSIYQARAEPRHDNLLGF
jgi:hypothetical protein